MPKIKFEPTKAHQVYKLSNGNRVPGASTISKIGDDPGALLHWAWDLGKQGIDYKKARDAAADAGTLAHWLIECHLKGVEPDLSDHSPNIIESAESSFLKFLNFWDDGGFKLVASEVQLVHESLCYGGTLDIVAIDRDNNYTLIDIKTSKSISTSFWRQLAAYGALWNENNPSKTLTRYIICRIGRNADDNDYEFAERKNLSLHLAAFLAALKLYVALKVAGK